MTLQAHPTGGYVHTADPGEMGYEGRPPRISVTDEEAKILSALAAGLTVYEIGTGLGVATRAMAETAVKVYTYDTDQWVRRTVYPALPQNVHPLFDGPNLAQKADMVFVDGLHTYEAVTADIALAGRCMPSLIVFHDMKLLAVQKAIRASGLRPVVIRTTYGLGIVRL